eukprot:1159989-Pelagomonas_calceolata.AAC.9
MLQYFFTTVAVGNARTFLWTDAHLVAHPKRAGTAAAAGAHTHSRFLTDAHLLPHLRSWNRSWSSKSSSQRSSTASSWSSLTRAGVGAGAAAAAGEHAPSWMPVLLPDTHTSSLLLTGTHLFFYSRSWSRSWSSGSSSRSSTTRSMFWLGLDTEGWKYSGCAAAVAGAGAACAAVAAG